MIPSRQCAGWPGVEPPLLGRAPACQHLLFSCFLFGELPAACAHLSLCYRGARRLGTAVLCKGSLRFQKCAGFCTRCSGPEKVSKGPQLELQAYTPSWMPAGALRQPRPTHRAAAKYAIISYSIEQLFRHSTRRIHTWAQQHSCGWTRGTLNNKSTVSYGKKHIQMAGLNNKNNQSAVAARRRPAGRCKGRPAAHPQRIGAWLAQRRTLAASRPAGLQSGPSQQQAPPGAARRHSLTDRGRDPGPPAASSSWAAAWCC